MTELSPRTSARPGLRNPYAVEEERRARSGAAVAAGATLAGAAGLLVLSAGAASADEDGSTDPSNPSTGVSTAFDGVGSSLSGAAGNLFDTAGDLAGGASDVAASSSVASSSVATSTFPASSAPDPASSPTVDLDIDLPELPADPFTPPDPVTSTTGGDLAFLDTPTDTSGLFTPPDPITVPDLLSTTPEASTTTSTGGGTGLPTTTGSSDTDAIDLSPLDPPTGTTTDPSDTAGSGPSGTGSGPFGSTPDPFGTSSGEELTFLDTPADGSDLFTPPDPITVPDLLGSTAPEASTTTSLPTTPTGATPSFLEQPTDTSGLSGTTTPGPLGSTPDPFGSSTTGDDPTFLDQPTGAPGLFTPPDLLGSTTGDGPDLLAPPTGTSGDGVPGPWATDGTGGPFTSPVLGTGTEPLGGSNAFTAGVQPLDLGTPAEEPGGDATGSGLDLLLDPATGPGGSPTGSDLWLLDGTPEAPDPSGTPVPSLSEATGAFPSGDPAPVGPLFGPTGTPFDLPDTGIGIDPTGADALLGSRPGGTEGFRTDATPSSTGDPTDLLRPPSGTSAAFTLPSDGTIPTATVARDGLRPGTDGSVLGGLDGLQAGTSGTGTVDVDRPSGTTGSSPAGAAEEEQGGSSNTALGYAAVGVPFGLGVGTMFRIYDPAMQGSLRLAGISSATRLLPAFGQDLAMLGGGSSIPITGDETIDRWLHGNIVDTAAITAIDAGLTHQVNPRINAWGRANPTNPASTAAQVARLNSGLPWASLALIPPVLSTANTLTDSFETDALGWETDPGTGRPVPPDNAAYYGDLTARSGYLGGTIWGAAQTIKNPQWALHLGNSAVDASQRAFSGLTGRPTTTATTTAPALDVPVNPATSLVDDIDNVAALATARPMPRSLSIAGNVLPLVLPAAQNWMVNRVTNPPPDPDLLTGVIDATNRGVVQPLQQAFGTDVVQQTGAVVGDTVTGCLYMLTTRANCLAGAVTGGGLAFRDKTTLGRDATQDVITSDGTVGDAFLDNVGGVFGQAGNVADAALNGLNAGLATGAAVLVPLHELLQYGRTQPATIEERLQFLNEEPSVQATNRAVTEYADGVVRNVNNAGTMISGVGTGAYNLLRYGNVEAPSRSGNPWCSDTVTNGCIKRGSEDPDNRNSMGVLVKGPAVPGSRYYDEARRQGIAGPATPDNPAAYQRCVAQGNCGVREVGPLYVGDGSGDPGNQLETFARNVTSNPTYLPQQLGNAVNGAIESFQRDPVGTTLRGAATIFR